MTGEYAWRKTGTKVLPGDAGLIIEPSRTTLPGLLKQAGYATGCIGKWHLGLGRGKPDWNGDVEPGPLELGFDHSFIIPATADRVPCVFVQDHRVVGLDPNDPITVSYKGPLDDAPLGKDHPELLKMKLSMGHDQTIVNGISRIGYMKGGKAALWVDEEIARTLTKEGVNFIEAHKNAPFFLYFASSDIHVPHAPDERFAGKSDCGIRGDTIEQLDACVGEIIATLDRLNLTKNTLVIFTSDNGPVVDDGYADGSVEKLNGHKPAGPWRGGKYTNWEGGTRMPFIVRWPGKVQPGTSAALVSQTDFVASLAAFAGVSLPADAGPDSRNVLPALLGESSNGRDHVVEQGGPLALRKGPWKFIPDGPGIGESTPKGSVPPSIMLFNLDDDPGEKNNVAPQNPDRVNEMTKLLRQIRTSGRDQP
jgi:arylsulfatase A-like enzyme